MKRIMKEVLSEKMLKEIFKALDNGESFEYQDENTQISITPTRISVQHQIPKNVKEIEEFLQYCDHLDDDLFVEVCETFDKGEIEVLQKQLDTTNYQDTINIFKHRVKEVANGKLANIINAADEEIRKQEQIILNARNAIELIHKELDSATIKYNV